MSYLIFYQIYEMTTHIEIVRILHERIDLEGQLFH